MSWAAEQLSAFRKARARRRAIGGLRELAKIRKVLEVMVDSYRQVNGMPAMFGPGMIEDQDPIKVIRGSGQPGSIIRPGDHQLVWLIEELAKEFRVPLTGDTDLEELAVSMGWVSPEGRLLMIPEVAKGLEISGELENWGHGS